MSSSPIVNFQESVSSFVQNSILNLISEWLKETKHVDVSVEELMNVLHMEKSVPKKIFKKPSKIIQSTLFVSTVPEAKEIPEVSSPKNPSSNSSSPKEKTEKTEKTEKKPETQISFPPHLNGSKSPSEEKKKPKKKPITDPNAPKCKYIFSRGEKAGQCCDKFSSEGSDLCSDHKKRQEKSTKESKSENKPQQVGFTVSPAKKEKETINLQKTSTEGIYVHPGSNILVRIENTEEGVVHLAFGVQDEDDVRPLQDSEKQIALSCGFALTEKSTLKPVEKKMELVKDRKNEIGEIPDF